MNYAELFETARSDIERSGVNDAPARNFWRALTLGSCFRSRARCALVGRADAALSAQRHRSRRPHVRPDDVPAGDAAAAGAAAPRMAAAFSNRLIARQRIAARRGPLSRRAADRLHPGPRLPERQPRHGRRAPRQRLRGRDAVAAAVLRIAARPQRRAGFGPRAGAADDRPLPARIATTRSSRTPAAADRTCGTTGICSKTIRATATRRAPGTRS